ncbi:MAG: hypothetical protein ACJA01_002243 [Saprospiraceae bacterium]|jgi:hypothetical protein
MMKNKIIGILSFLIVLSACTPKQPLDSERGWNTLFENVHTFTYDGDADWTNNKDQICNILGSGNGFLITNKKYNSFQLEFEFKPDAIVNSGIFIRCKAAEMSPVDCYELNIWDEHPDQSNRTGSIVHLSTASKTVNTIGLWNTMRVIAKGNRIQIWINDIQTMNYEEAVSRAGVIGFQAFEEGQICFRNTRIKGM